MTPAELIHFEGEFGAQEREEIVEAIKDAERHFPAPSWSFELGALWIVSSTEVPGRSRVITAHRLGEGRAIVAKTPQELSESIRAYARKRSDE